MVNRNLRILLVSPSGDYFVNDPEFSEYVQTSRDMRTILHFWNGIGLGLPTIAALTPRKHEVIIVDENQENLSKDKTFDVVGITAMTHQANRAYEIASEFREKGSYVVMGGIHATVCPEEAQLHVDSVFIGEAEKTWVRFLQDFLEGKPRAIYEQSEYGVVDMKKSPVPRYCLLSKYEYPVVFVQTTRGCPHDCEFCVASNVYGRTYKRKSTSQVVEEVKEIKKHWKRAQIGFADDNMFVNRKYSFSLINEFKKLSFSWFAVCDISVAEDLDMLRNMHESGCRTLLIGFESVTKENLVPINRNRWKAKKFDYYKEYIRRIQKNGIGVYGSFILGFEHDTKDTVDEIIRFINNNHLMGGHATILTPLPGSRLRTRMEKEGKILERDWRWYTLWNAVIKHSNLTPTELEQGIMRVFKGIYNPDSNKKRAAYFREICEKLVQK